MSTDRPNELQLLTSPDYNSPIIDEPVSQEFYSLYGIPFFIVVSYIIFVVIYRMRMEEVLKKLTEIKPELPKCGRIDENNFEFRGPLKLQSKFKGNVEHALVNEPSQPIEELVYDENLNEVVDIGSVVEEIEGMSDITMSKQHANDNSTIFASKKSMKKKNSRLSATSAKARLKMGKSPDQRKNESARKQ